MPAAGRALLTVAVATSALAAVPVAHAAPPPRCQGEAATIVGTAGGDNLAGTSERDVIWGGGGDDRIYARHGNDLVCAGPGQDNVHAGNGADKIYGEAGDDELDSSTGHDDVVDGGTGDDELIGFSQGALLQGGPGNDKLSGQEEHVVLDGGPDDDKLMAIWIRVTSRGGDGDDFIRGHLSGDVDVDGGPGDDTIELNGGKDGRPAKPVRGGPGDDVILGQSGGAWIDAGPGNDTVDLGDGAGGWARGGSGNDTMTTGGTKETSLSGDEGDDTLTLTKAGSVAEGGADTDLLTGSLWDDILDGGDGTDTVRAGEGDDTLTGGEGDDQLWGEQGADTCAGGGGHDECDGGPLGTPEPSQDDPDLCRADVEVKRNCRGEDAAWAGSADGTLTHSGGVIETWSATVDLDEVGAGYYWVGDAEIAWRVAGTDAAGCTYDGAAALDGRSEMAFFEGTYSLTVRRSTLQAEVEVDCPHEDPKTVLYNPMNTNAAEADDQPLPEEPVTALSGSVTYVPEHAPEGEVTWSWSLTRSS